jgi:ABC-2 type transport system permease protein
MVDEAARRYGACPDAHGGAESDTFYVIGNALQYAAVPCQFSMTRTIAGERFQQTLPFILVSPAGRMSLFLGPAVPVIINGLFAFAFAVSSLLLGVHIPADAIGGIVLATAVASFSCTGLGLISAGISFVVRGDAGRKRRVRERRAVPADALPRRHTADGLRLSR